MPSSRSSMRSAWAARARARACRPDRPGPGDRGPSGPGADRSRPRDRGRGRPEHRRTAAAAAGLLRRRRPRPGRRPRCDEHRRRGHDLDGRILGHHDEPARIEDGPERGLDRVDALFDSLLRTTQDIPGRLWGVGIGVPGPVEFASGRPISPPIMPGWDGYPIRERFAHRYRAPVWVDNDVNVLALGEWRSGVAPGHDNVVVIKIGTGIGAGIISDGRLHRGAQGSAGDVGHIQVVDDPSVVCRCGNIGCLEALAGGAAIGRAGQAAALEGRSTRLRAASTSTAACRPRTWPARRRSATRSRSPCSRPPAGWSAQCWRAS